MGTVVASERTKSGQTKRRRRREVPMVGLAYGLLGGPWAEAWLKARLAEGLNAAKGGTLFPARSISGWTHASADIAEANTILRQILMRYGLGAVEAAGFGTHSCKATVLSWCAKAGLKSEHRRLLGGHARPESAMSWSTPGTIWRHLCCTWRMCWIRSGVAASTRMPTDRGVGGHLVYCATGWV